MQKTSVPYLHAWIIFFAIVSVAGAIAGGVAGAAAGFILDRAGASRTAILVCSALAGFVASAPISFFTFKWAVRTVLVDPLVRSLSAPAAT